MKIALRTFVLAGALSAGAFLLPSCSNNSNNAQSKGIFNTTEDVFVPEERHLNMPQSNNYEETNSVPDSQIEFYGRDLARKLKGRTSDNYYTSVNERLSKLNTNNVMYFLKGFYTTNNDCKIIEMLDSEHDKRNPIRYENKLRLIKSVLDVSKKELADNDDAAAYTDFVENDIIGADNYNYENNPEKFNKHSTPANKNDNELIDECMYEIYKMYRDKTNF